MAAAPIGSSAQDAFRLIGLTALAAAASPLTQIALSPSFGSLPLAVRHDSNTLLLAFALGCGLSAFTPGRGAFVSKIRIIWAFWIPSVLQLLSRFHTELGPERGPTASSILACHAVLVFCGYGFDSTSQRVALKLGWGRNISTFALPVLGYLVLRAALGPVSEQVYALAERIQIVPLQLAQAGLHSLLGPSPNFVFAIPAVLHAVLFNPHYSTGRVNAALRAHNWTVLDRQRSNTGYVSVLENFDQGYRMLRCDHSFLGGEWTLTPARRSDEGWTAPEPAYVVFELLEAVRLVERSPPLADADARALVIGLGVGTAPKALISHGVDTTIVELDPVVHDYATRYFDLPKNHTSIISDAVEWTSSQDVSAPKYDYILHDVFTGGAEPIELFSTSFLTNLRNLLSADGIIAINYAGDLSLPLTQQILHTIDTVFDGRRQCRMFRDAPPLPTPDVPDFLNVVIFCRNKRNIPVTFRMPVEADFLGSQSRRRHLLPRPDWELAFPSVVADEGEEDELERKKAAERQQLESAKRHWQIMRHAIPDVVWETW